MGTQRGSGVQSATRTQPLPCPGGAGAVSPLPRLGTWHRAKTRLLGPSSTQQNRVGLPLSLLIAQIGGRNFTSARKLYQHKTFNLCFPGVHALYYTRASTSLKTFCLRQGLLPKEDWRRVQSLLCQGKGGFILVASP